LSGFDAASKLPKMFPGGNGILSDSQSHIVLEP